MGNLGFMFSFENSNLRKVVFIETNKFVGIIILGIENFFNSNDCEFYFLNKNLSLNDYLFLDTHFKYSKIHTSNKTICDLNDFIFWFDGRKYREIYRLFLIEDIEGIEENLVARVNDLLGYFL